MGTRSTATPQQPGVWGHSSGGDAPHTVEHVPCQDSTWAQHTVHPCPGFGPGWDMAGPAVPWDP